MTVDEFEDWTVFASVHPFPVDVIDLHGAMNLAALANINRKPGTPPVKPTDFLVIREPVAVEGPKLTEAQRMRLALKGG